jgi:CcmD family protein
MVFTVLMLVLSASLIWAQQPVEMADQFRADGKIRVVIGVIAIIFAGLVVYLIRLDRRIKKLEDR